MVFDFATMVLIVAVVSYAISATIWDDFGTWTLIAIGLMGLVLLKACWAT